MPKETSTPKFSDQKIDDPEEWDDMMGKLSDDDLTEDELDDMEGEMEDAGTEELTDIKESMSDGSSVDLTPSYVLPFSKETSSSYKVLWKVAFAPGLPSVI